MLLAETVWTQSRPAPMLFVRKDIGVSFSRYASRNPADGPASTNIRFMQLSHETLIALTLSAITGMPVGKRCLKRSNQVNRSPVVRGQANRPSARASSDKATGPAVDARMMFAPNTLTSAPADVNCSTSSSLMPPSGPTTT